MAQFLPPPFPPPVLPKVTHGLAISRESPWGRKEWDASLSTTVHCACIWNPISSCFSFALCWQLLKGSIRLNKTVWSGILLIYLYCLDFFMQNSHTLAFHWCFERFQHLRKLVTTSQRIIYFLILTSNWPNISYLKCHKYCKCFKRQRVIISITNDEDRLLWVFCCKHQ